MAIVSKVLLDTPEFTDIEESDESIGYVGYRREWKAGTSPANESALRGVAESALTELRVYIALPSPTNVQTAAAVKVLCRVGIALIRLQLGRFDSAS